MLEKAFWIGCKEDFGDICPEFIRAVPIVKKAVSAILTVTAIGVYEARINGVRIGDFILAPGCTVYRERLQVQSYDITSLLSESNELSVTVSTG